MRKALGGLACLMAMTTAACAGGTYVGSSASPMASCVRVVDVGDVSQPEGNPVGDQTLQSFTFTVTSTGCSAGGTLTYVTVSDTAIAGEDYEAVKDVMTFTKGDMSPHTITVQVIRDLKPERDEQFRVTFCKAPTHLESAYIVPGKQGVGTIIDDDAKASTASIGHPADPYQLVDYGCGR
jgi:hypothetical protein